MNILCLLRQTCLVVCALMMATVSLGTTVLPAAGQDGVGSPPATAEGAPQDPGVTPTPVIGSASGGVQPAPDDPSPAPQQNQQGNTQNTTQTSGPVASTSAGDTGAPILAQGLIYLT
ncbi:MAG TPA: hypothetical protein VD789_13875, partial [Thermomicrobiales bacterium]|nr:hypothetical protein [Thermomicrobiales bacterium]